MSLLDTVSNLMEVHLALINLYDQRRMLEAQVLEDQRIGKALRTGGSVKLGKWELVGILVKPERLNEWEKHNLPKADIPGFHFKIKIHSLEVKEVDAGF